jgi:hypothetical protein
MRKLMDLLVQKTRYSNRGCKITTVVREHPSYGTTEEIILQAEFPPPVDLVELVEEDTGRWLIGGT